MEKKMVLTLALTTAFALTTLFTITARAHHGPAHAEFAAAAGAAESGKTLIVYFSRTGNTKEIADQIHKHTGADIFEIVPQNAYPSDYKATTEQARKELDSNFRPALKTLRVSDLETYDVIFLGFPIWWGTIPTSVMTFLEGNNLSGKTLVPFATHGGSGLASAPGDINRFAPRATLLEGIAISGSGAVNSQNQISAWLTRLGMLSGGGART